METLSLKLGATYIRAAKQEKLTLEMTLRYAHLALQRELAAVQRLCDTESLRTARSDTAPLALIPSAAGITQPGI